MSKFVLSAFMIFPVVSVICFADTLKVSGEFFNAPNPASPFPYVEFRSIATETFFGLAAMTFVDSEKH